MSEIEKMKRYIERTKMNDRLDSLYRMNLAEAFELAVQADTSSDLSFNAICLAFNYGKAKGYRAAKAEGRVRA